MRLVGGGTHGRFATDTQQFLDLTSSHSCH